MATINNYGDCSTDTKGSGKLSCDKSYWGDLKGFGLLNKGTTWTITDGVVAITEVDWTNKIKAASLFPYQNSYDYDSVGNENEVNTSSTQIEKDVRAGLPKVQWMYADGNCRHASLWDKKGFDRWDLVLFYSNGMRLAHNTAQTRAKGFDAGNFSVQSETIQKGTDLQMSTCSAQLKNADEFAVQNVFLTWTDLGFNALEIAGFNDVNITLDPIAAGTTFTASIVSSCNTGSSILDLDDDAKYVLLGTQASATTISSVAYNATTSKYTFTVSPALVGTDTVQIKLGDGTFNVVDDTLGNLYKGTSNTITVS